MTSRLKDGMEKETMQLPGTIGLHGLLRCAVAIKACRRVEFARVLTFVLCRLMSRFVIGGGGKMKMGGERRQCVLAEP
jgi:hypothetical protein